MRSCCQYHSSIRPNGCAQGRDYPTRKSIALEKLFNSRLAVIGFLLISFGLAGTWEYADIERAELAAKQNQVKTARAE